VTIAVKRVYDPPAAGDGFRVLVDRLWPRGIRKEDARIGHWAKDLAPSTELRKWYGHAPGKWPEFRKRYRRELDANTDAVADLLDRLPRGAVTLVFGSKETELNNAAVLKEYLEERLGGSG
jgi:uncharacterized protein YeaO (DUF488 family)